MKYLKNRVQKVFIIAFLASSSLVSVSAFDTSITQSYFNGPTVSKITDTSATLSLSPEVLASITDGEKSGIYFEYIQKNLVCIAIYPTPKSCLPNKTEVGKTNVVITGLKPATSYIVTYGHENTIRCIKAPCPTNDLQSLPVEFKTKAARGGGALVPTITKYLAIGSSGSQVTVLQNFLYKEGYLSTPATGYFGSLTFQAVKKFQGAHNISKTGTVGPITRAILATMISASSPDTGAVMFEGVVTGYSTACFSDGECSITVDGKKVITGRGRLQQPLGEVRITPDLGGYEKTIGAHTRVYARETSDGFTLYGSHDYYVEISLPTKGKLPAGSTGTGAAPLL